MTIKDETWEDNDWIYTRVTTETAEGTFTTTYINPRKSIKYYLTYTLLCFSYLPVIFFWYVISLDWIPRVKNKQASKATFSPSTYGLPSHGQEEEKKETKK